MIFIGILLYCFFYDFGSKWPGKAQNEVTIPRHPAVTSGPILGQTCFSEKRQKSRKRPGAGKPIFFVDNY